jgi:hypothetical protein
MKTLLNVIIFGLLGGGGFYLGYSLFSDSWSEGIIPAIVFGVAAGIINVVRDRKKRNADG